jgi:hypothetical protein
VWWFDTNVSEERATSIFKVEVLGESESGSKLLCNCQSVSQSVSPFGCQPFGTHDQILGVVKTVAVLLNGAGYEEV